MPLDARLCQRFDSARALLAASRNRKMSSRRDVRAALNSRARGVRLQTATRPIGVSSGRQRTLERVRAVERYTKRYRCAMEYLKISAVVVVSTPNFTGWGIIKGHYYTGGIYALMFTADAKEIYAAGMGTTTDPAVGSWASTVVTAWRTCWRVVRCGFQAIVHRRGEWLA